MNIQALIKDEDIIKNTKSFTRSITTISKQFRHKVDNTEFQSLDHNTDLIIDFMG